MQVTDAMVAKALREFEGYERGNDTDAMRAALEAALAEMWRPVSEYIGHDIVLAWSKDGGRVVAFKDIAGRWYAQPGCTPIDHHLPTMFAPLPPPPMGK